VDVTLIFLVDHGDFIVHRAEITEVVGREWKKLRQEQQAIGPKEVVQLLSDVNRKGHSRHA
jgi:hypothetical protein